MITFEQAKDLAQTHVEKNQANLNNHDLVVAESIEFNEGWLFFFTTRKCLETKDLKYAPLGLGPVIVGKENGDAYQASSGTSNEARIRQFKEYLEAKKR